MEQHIRILKALHGDSFILNCVKGNQHGNVVVDGGPYRDNYKIVQILEEYESIDLMVVTHYDDDHIGGLLAYIEKHKDDRPFPIKEIWVNCSRQIPVTNTANISFNQAKKLSNLLFDINKDLEEKGLPTVTWEPLILAGQRVQRPYADFLILSPEEESLSLNFFNFNSECGDISSRRSRQKSVLTKSLQELSTVAKKKVNLQNKQEVINLSSIAFVVSCDSFSALMMGDSYPSTIIKTLESNGFNNSDNRLRVSYTKIAHHGSAKNTSNTLLDMLECDTYIISTNGGNGVSCHPDRETIGNIAWHPNRNHNSPVNLVFNYPMGTIESIGYKFLNEGECDKDGSYINVYSNIDKLPV